MEVSSQLHASAASLQGIKPSDWIGGWVVVRGRLDAMEERNVTYPNLELNPSLPVHSLVAISTEVLSYHPPCSFLNATDQDWNSPNNM
jgi:hypothetical protein